MSFCVWLFSHLLPGWRWPVGSSGDGGVNGGGNGDGGGGGDDGGGGF